MRQGISNMISTAGGVDSGAADADLSALRARGGPLEPRQCLRWALDRYGAGFAMTTSFGIQSSVLLHMLSRLPGGEEVPVIWVDTDYLPPETYRYAQTLSERRGRASWWRSPACHPRMEALHGRLWETGREEDMDLYLRLRKVDPLEEALDQGQVRCWASGVRRGQTDLRNTMTVLDPIRDRLSLRLLGWTNRDVFYYLRSAELPQHPLFDQGIPLLGIGIPVLPMAWKEKRSTRFGGQRQVRHPRAWVMGDGI